MESTVLQKEELIAMLKTITSQLNQLEESIEARIPQKKVEWQNDQDTRINECEKQLDRIEQKISSIEKKEEVHQPAAIRIQRGFQKESFTF
nr:hypothetical protein [uncultured Bacillus sp.]